MLKHRMFSPLRRNLIEPLYALQSRTPRLKYWQELERTQYLPERTLRQVQWRRLKDLLLYVWENNEFYRNRMSQCGLAPEMISTPDQFRKIPVLTKDDIRVNTIQMISKEHDIESLLKFKTGGSTGKSLEIYMSEECSELRNACARRHDRWTGWEPGEPIGAVWGNPERPSKLKDSLRDWFISPVIYLDTMCVTEESVRTFVAEWKQVRPTLLYGHAHSLFVLAEYVRDLKIRCLNPKGILSTSMMLMPHERKVIESVFGVKVTDRYGCEEVSLIASECEKHEGMHLNIEHLYIEFIREDGICASPGETGRIIVTDLMNRAMPFIRYEVEDMGRLIDRKCSCGRGLPLMESVIGRVADFLLRKDGTMIAGISIIENTLTKIRGIHQMQIIQEYIDDITLNVVVGSDFGRDSEKELNRYFYNLFGDGTKITINRKTRIDQEKNGKYRFSICKVRYNKSSKSI